MKKIILIVGARPNFMKAYPVYEALKEDFELTLIHTGQHFDAKMSDVFFNQLKFPKPDIHLSLEKKTKSGDFDDKLYVNNEEYLKNKDDVIEDLMNYDQDLGQLGEIRDKLKIEFGKINPDLVIVFGDVTSTLAAGLSAKTLNIDLAHVESGLRSGDMLMPEEVNRILTDHITKYYFITEESGVDNLKEIGITENVYLVGNTMIDTQKKYLQQALDTKYHETLNVKSKEYVLITLHRPSNVDDLDKLKEIFDDFEELSKKETLVYPIHPRTKNNLEKLGYLQKVQENPNIILDEPLGYLEFTCLMANCKYLVTDSGGLQEESTALDIPCFTLRENTERPSTLIENNGTNQMIHKISEIELKECKGSMDSWDGKSNKRICNILIKEIIKSKLEMSKKELNEYRENLKEKYDIPTKYITGELLEKTKNKEIVINNKTFKIEIPTIWKLEESSNTEYQIHTLNQIIQSQIALFFYNDQNKDIIKYCIAVIENWFGHNEKIELLKWYDEMNANWQDMSVSYRLGNILLVYELAIKFNVEINKERFKTEILYHIEWLKSHLIHNKTLSFSSNHNLFISRYLILGSNIYNLYFDKLEDLYINLGVENFIEAISNNVDIIDLLSKEHSTNYHILYYRQLNKLLSIIDIDHKNYKKLKDLSDKMYNNLNYFIYPNNHFVQIGDTDDKLCNYEFKDLFSLKLFKNVGYGVYKKENIYLSLSSSCHSRYHKHIDELSINYFNEYPILIEGGRYSYDDYKPININELWRNTYFLSQRSKNSIVIDDNYFSFRQIIDELNNKTYTYASGITRGEIKDNGVVIQGTNPLLLLMKNIEHNRKVNLDKNNILLVKDKLVSHDEKEHKSTRHFHFHYDWELVEIIKNKVIFKHKLSNKMLEFEDLSNGEIKYYCGQEKPFIQGFTSDYEHHKIEIPTIEIRNTFNKNILLKSKIIYQLY